VGTQPTILSKSDLRVALPHHNLPVNADQPVPVVGITTGCAPGDRIMLFVSPRSDIGPPVTAYGPAYWSATFELSP